MQKHSYVEFITLTIKTTVRERKKINDAFWPVIYIKTSCTYSRRRKSRRDHKTAFFRNMNAHTNQRIFAIIWSLWIHIILLLLLLIRYCEKLRTERLPDTTVGERITLYRCDFRPPLCRVLVLLNHQRQHLWH